jgi:hypothetical protein
MFENKADNKVKNKTKSGQKRNEELRPPNWSNKLAKIGQNLAAKWAEIRPPNWPNFYHQMG